ncbi:MAG: TVP38/TMEM64 family protein [Nitrospinaceae bacterium]
MNNKSIGLCVILLGTSLFYFIYPEDSLNLEWLKDNQRPLNTFYRDNSLTVMVGFVALFLVIGLFLLPGATLLSVFSGAVFGLPLGPLLVSLGSTFGAVVAFFVARYILRDWVEERFGEKLTPIHEGLCENDIHFMLVLRLVPLFPFFLVNIAMGVSPISWKVFLVGTLLGKLPAIWIYANAGSHLANLQSISAVTSPGMLGALTLLILLVLTPVIYKQRRKPKKTGG